MTTAALLALFVVGFGVGFLAGLVGIGGGVLIVPFLYFFYSHATWSGVSLPVPLHAPVAHATSLLIIVPTAIAGTLAYARNGLVAWRVALPIGVASVCTAALAATVATRLPPELLKTAFGAFIVFTGVQLIVTRHAEPKGPPRSSLVLSLLTGAVIGAFSALLGVGGGLVAIPLLMHLLRMDVRHVAATSLAIVACAATSGTITYMLTAGGVAALPSGHVGYVHVAAALPMLPGAILAARWGARMNQRLGAKRLRVLFSLIFVVIGVNLIIRNLPLLLDL